MYLGRIVLTVRPITFYSVLMPRLSVIIPTLNEAEALPLLLSDLASQEFNSLEIIVVDGGSSDGTCDLVREWLASGRLQGRCLVSECGRGRQMNVGARNTDAEWLLFLHADSRLPDVKQLQVAIDFLSRLEHEKNTDAIAGRFALTFDHNKSKDDFAFYYYETKARLGRLCSIHGDQGMMLKASFFAQTGPFREDLPVMEDTSFAEVIRQKGKWYLLPGEIITSSRRFCTEGIKKRQTLNALMMNFLAIGWLDFFQHAPDLYRQQKNTNMLQLRPFFDLIKKLTSQMPFSQRLKLWLSTGGYVRAQAWQIGLWLDCRKAYKHGRVVSTAGPWLLWFDRWFEPLTDNGPCRLVTAFLVRVWFVFQ